MRILNPNGQPEEVGPYPLYMQKGIRLVGKKDTHQKHAEIVFLGSGNYVERAEHRTQGPYSTLAECYTVLSLKEFVEELQAAVESGEWEIW